MNAQVAPNLTNAIMTSEQVLALENPTDTLRVIAQGGCVFSGDRDRAAAALRVARQSGTSVILAAAKRFDSLAALVTADNAARASVPSNQKIDSTYRTGMDQLRAAAATLGWDAVMSAASIGQVYRAHSDKKKATAAPTDTADTMPPTVRAPEVTGSAAPAVRGQWEALQQVLSGLPDEIAIGILADAMTAALAAKLEHVA